jgi:hypothetical protein
VERKKLGMKIQLSGESSSSDLLGEMSGELTEQDLVEFGDILEAATESLKGRIERESTLTIELTGRVQIEKSTEANVGFDQIMVFKVGGGLAGERETAMKLILETKIIPDDSTGCL